MIICNACPKCLCLQSKCRPIRLGQIFVLSATCIDDNEVCTVQQMSPCYFFFSIPTPITHPTHKCLVQDWNHFLTMVCHFLAAQPQEIHSVTSPFYSSRTFSTCSHRDVAENVNSLNADLPTSKIPFNGSPFPGFVCLWHLMQVRWLDLFSLVLPERLRQTHPSTDFFWHYGVKYCMIKKKYGQWKFSMSISMFRRYILWQFLDDRVGYFGDIYC